MNVIVDTRFVAESVVDPVLSKKLLQRSTEVEYKPVLDTVKDTHVDNCG